MLILGMVQAVQSGIWVSTQHLLQDPERLETSIGPQREQRFIITKTIC